MHLHLVLFGGGKDLQKDDRPSWVMGLAAGIRMDFALEGGGDVPVEFHLAVNPAHKPHRDGRLVLQDLSHAS